VPLWSECPALDVAPICAGLFVPREGLRRLQHPRRNIHVGAVDSGEKLERLWRNVATDLTQLKLLSTYGDGSQTRDFAYLDDLIREILAAIRSNQSGVYQLGSGKAVSTAEEMPLRQQKTMFTFARIRCRVIHCN
jgi:NAD dependent epimerase/dehydratase family